ncbi:MAG: hypothetical protein H5T64_07280 [Chloroflexi bacterium]|nr:hypothetical protein [Chloroflexota bacterium]
MKLTGRQKVFLEQFLDIYRESPQPLHYSVVAERLGVSSITAYDMLRLLEERGLVISEYIVPGRGAGPGRSTIVFYPTERAVSMLAELAGEDWDREEWELVKQRILEAMRKGRGSNYEELLNELLNRIPERKSPLIFCAEMITAVILNLHLVKADLTQSGSLDGLAALGLPGDLGLSALAGLTFGLSLVERANRRFVSVLLSHTSRYQDTLSRLSASKKRLLVDFVQDVVKAIGA